jgi:hypothetical protein
LWLLGQASPEELIDDGAYSPLYSLCDGQIHP